MNLKLDVDPKAMKAAKAGGDAPASDAQPYSLTAASGPATADIKLDGLKTRPLLELWAFLVAHPTRPELAANEAAFKSLLAAALASQAKINESATIEKITAQIPQGQIAIDSAKFGASAAMGPNGAFGEHFEANGLALPADLIPGPFKGFARTPSPSASTPPASTSPRPRPKCWLTCIWLATARRSRPTTRPRSAPS